MSKNDIKVLVVEDDAMIAEVLIGFLNKMGHTRKVAHTDSLRKSKLTLESDGFDLVLLDLYLPDGNGLELLKWIRVNDINVDVILITADKHIESIKEARKYGVKDYLVKPFKFDRFEKSINQFIDELMQLEKIELLNQKVIDTLLHNTESQNDEDGLNKTYHSIMNYLKQNYPNSYTASEIADKLGISRITARRYLENMEDIKVVKLELDYGHVGRPKNKYSYIDK